MRTKKTVAAVFWALGLLLAVSAAFLLQRNGASVAYAADGWQQDDTGWYYLEDDVKLSGLQTINGKQYYFDQQGYRTSGAVMIQGAMYYFNPADGALCTGIRGMARISGTNTYYYFLSKKNGTVAVSRWVTHNGKKYYAGKDGKLLFGTVRINNKLFHLTEDGLLTGYARSSYNKKYYYATSKGVLKTGRRLIDGKRYYFSPANGARQSGWIKDGKYTYYFRKSNGAAATGWIKISGKYYYFNSIGRQLTGKQKINGSTYYLNPAKKGARTTKAWVRLSGKYYYFGSNGKLQTGLIKTSGGKLYYSNVNGVRQYGWIILGRRKYYFKESSGVARTGWFTTNGKTYYLNATSSSRYYGSALTGWAKIGQETYYFNNKGELQKDCWQYDSASKAYYYLDSVTGKVLKGRQKINGIWFDLGTTGAYTKVTTGSYLIKVNRALNCITVYRGGVPIKAFVCSTAADRVSTPLGTFSLLDKLRWHELNGPTWGQYCSHITGSILFHSVPNTRYRDNHSLNAAAYNKLGEPASAGCIRMTVADAKWLFDNCPIGTKVVIYDDWSSPGPLGKPTAPKIPLSQNYDPTDPYA